MRFIIFLFFVLLHTEQSWADQFSSSVHSISYGKSGEDNFIRFENGRVGFFKQSETGLLISLLEIMNNQSYAEVSLDKKSTVLFLVEDKFRGQSLLNDSRPWLMDREPFRPTVVKSINDALRIQNKMRRDYRSAGQCYNRAHVWAFEEYNRSDTNLMKIFMFFTERYIRKYKFHWWFHVTPMVYVKNLNSPRTLDRRYTAGPRTTKVWSDVFVKSKRTCPIVKKFDDFWLNQKVQDCFHIYSSMYYVIPRDLERRDLSGIDKVEFGNNSIQKAYLDGFGVRWVPR